MSDNSQVLLFDSSLRFVQNDRNSLKGLSMACHPERSEEPSRLAQELTQSNLFKFYRTTIRKYQFTTLSYAISKKIVFLTKELPKYGI